MQAQNRAPTKVFANTCRKLTKANENNVEKLKEVIHCFSHREYVAELDISLGNIRKKKRKACTGTDVFSRPWDD